MTEDSNTPLNRSDDVYERVIKTLAVYTGALLLNFQADPPTPRDIIIRNFIARGMVSLESIRELWKHRNFQDCWVLHRCLLERLFHIHWLAENDQFELFEKWSFVKQIEANQRVLSDGEVRAKIDEALFRPTQAQRARYKALKKEELRWVRPKAEDVARDMDLLFLYKYGYDYASRFVHPMANDGEHDFIRLTGREVTYPFDQRMILGNSILGQVILTQVGLNASKWLLSQKCDYPSGRSPQPCQMAVM
jgi:hypothetical protein